MMKVYNEHSSHDLVLWTPDYTHIEDDNILGDFTDEVLVEGYSDYECFNLCDD